VTKKKCNGVLFTEGAARVLSDNDLTAEEFRSLTRLLREISRASVDENEDDNTARAHEMIIKSWLADIRGGLVQ
jgi:hypothetical protein